MQSLRRKKNGTTHTPHQPPPFVADVRYNPKVRPMGHVRTHFDGLLAAVEVDDPLSIAMIVGYGLTVIIQRTLGARSGTGEGNPFDWFNILMQSIIPYVAFHSNIDDHALNLKTELCCANRKMAARLRGVMRMLKMNMISGRSKRLREICHH